MIHISSRKRSQKGQLLIPMLALILLFGTFLAGYVRWCRGIYWQMRMDIAAESVALSAARAQAGMLNNLASLQTLGNGFLQKAEVVDTDIAHMQISAKKDFEMYHNSVRGFLKGYLPYTMRVANLIADRNGSQIKPLPSPLPQHRLLPKGVLTIYFAKWLPVGFEFYENVYYQRSWRQDQRNPQPNHENSWAVANQGRVGIASAGIWLDVSPSDPIANGGFPRSDGDLLEHFGIQCLYPHFNARLVSTPRAKQLALTIAARMSSDE